MKKDRKKQVMTTRQKYGKDHYKLIGSDGGKKSTTHYTSETGRLASKKRWDAYRQKQKEIEENINE